MLDNVHFLRLSLALVACAPQITGSGPTSYVQLVEYPDSSSSSSSSKPFTSKASPELAPPPPPSPSSSQDVSMSSTEPVASPKDQQVLASGSSGKNDTNLRNNVTNPMSSPKKTLSDEASSPRASSGSDASPTAKSAAARGGVIREEEARRLCSETRRILLCHQEHAMTLTELVEQFSTAGDPTHPTPSTLYQALKKQSTGSRGSSPGGGGGGATATDRKFEVSPIVLCVDR